MALSDAWLRSVVGKERDKVLVKSDRDGLSVRVSPKGRVVFQYRYQWAGKGERLDIGTYPATGLKEAREEVIRLRGELESNRNPRLVKQAEKRKATEAMTVESVIRAWYEAYCVKNKKGSEQILRSFELHLFSKIGNIPHDAATLHDWLEVLEPLSTKTPAIADRLLINAKQAHVWAYKRKLIETRPLSDITGKDMDIRKGQKKRFLTHDEIKILYAAIDGSRMVPKYRAFIKLLLHFGCRSSELITARVDDFDFICHVAFNQKPLTRRERANNVKKRDFLSKYSGVAREVLEALLDKYMNTGIYEIEKTEILQLDPFKKFGKPSKIATYFGGKAGYIQAVKALEEELYKAG